ncbi:MAG: MBL fold metallo-hydrolase, partial [Candidatus Rokuibacteriota bacterium]
MGNPVRQPGLQGLDHGGSPGDATATPAPNTDPTERSDRMTRLSYAIAAGILAALCLGVVAYAQQPAQPPFATTKVDGTDNVYIFRYGNHQAMFVVTSAGVIATDPIGYGRPQAVVTYVDEIKKVTTQPIKYLIYSHHHFDHIAGGKPFKDAGAIVVAHKRAWERLDTLKDPHTVLPD